MTVTYDPDDPAYFDETDLRSELTRVFDLCHGCRLCLSLCPSFPTLFDAIDARDGAVEDLTVAEQDQVVSECYQCKLCYVKCPYIPPHEWQLDFPKLMQRAEAVDHRNHGTLKGAITTRVFGHTDLVGRVSSATAPITNRVIATPGSVARKLIDRTVGLAAERVMPPYARTRFSTWFKKRRRQGEPQLGRPEQARAAVFATCLVEYQNADLGKDLVKVYEHNGVTCDVPDGTVCCGAPWLHSGEFAQFTKQAARNVDKLAASIRAGHDIVVPQPTCGYVLKRDYPDYLKSDEARFVAEHTYDATEYLWKLHKQQLAPGASSVTGATGIETDFTGEVPGTTAYHVPCHLQAQNIGLRSRDLIKLTGSKVTVIHKCSGIDGMWGMRSEHYDLARQVARPLADAIDKADADVVSGDCHLANGAIDQETGRRALHPLQLLARAYGIPEEIDDPRR